MAPPAPPVPTPLNIYCRNTRKLICLQFGRTSLPLVPLNSRCGIKMFPMHEIKFQTTLSVVKLSHDDYVTDVAQSND